MKLQDLTTALRQDPEFIRVEKELRFKIRLADAVLYARVAQGWSQSELARRVHTRQANISRIEAAISNPTLDLIHRLCDVLDLDLTFSGPGIPDKLNRSTRNETFLTTISEEIIRVDDQVDNIFGGSYETKTEKSANNITGVFK